MARPKHQRKSQCPFSKLAIGILVVLSSAAAFAQQSNYPHLDISGYKKWEYKRVNVAPSRNYFSGLTQLGGYYPSYSGGPWQERLQLRILGQLSENLAVSYDLEQQPETPEKYNVKVAYFNNELTFGDFTANFSGNEFASASKYLNGVMITAKDSWYDIIAVPSAKLKSQTQSLTTQYGNNSMGPYNLGNGSIIEGSEKIELNEQRLIRNLDYTIDYFEGNVTFNRILTSLDEFKYTYEYTNILDLFFPSLSKRDFLGFQSRFTINPEEFGKPTPKREAVKAFARESFPISASESEQSEEEASGQYRLEHVPVVKFSEKITFRGRRLKSNEDYLIRYDSGRIKLSTKFLPSQQEPLIVEYNYYQTTRETDVIRGIGSRGPYVLSFDGIVYESERIEVDGKLVVRDLDYTINYKTGQVVFGLIIGPTSQIKASYRHKVMEFASLLSSTFPKELTIGATYLKESAKKSETTASSNLIETFRSSEIISDNYTLYLSNRPIVPSSEAALTIWVDGQIITAEVDYAIPETSIDPGTGAVIVTPEAALAYINDRSDPSDGHDTATIKFLNTAIIDQSTGEVTVAYTYYRSIVGQYSGVGKDIQGPYYLRNVRNIVPGTETVQVWEQGSSIITTYTRNSSFEANAGSTGYSINYNSNNPSITFNEELSTTKNFQILYQYIPPAGYEGDDLSQSLYGFDGGFLIGNIFKIDASYAKSETDQVYIAEATRESFVGNDTKTYTLHSSQDIIENSEKVYVNNNLLNKDIDYYFGYTAPGQVTFYYITPASADAIAIDYQFQSQSGIPVGQDVKAGAAYRLGAQTKILGDVLTLSGQTKQVDRDFTPMGGTSINLGSRYQDYKFKYNPEYHSLSLNYAYIENANPIGAATNRFLRSYDNSATLGIKPAELVQINFNWRNLRTLDDTTEAFSTQANDKSLDSYALSLIPVEYKRGQVAFNQKYDWKRTFSQVDVERDSNNFSETNMDYLHAKLDLDFTDRLKAGFDFQQSNPKTIALNSSSTEATAEAVSSYKITTDTAYKLTFDLTAGKLEKWTATVNLLDHREKSLISNFLSTDEAASTKNETYHMDLIPIKPLKIAMDHNRQERSTVLVGGANPLSSRTSSKITYSPLSWLGGGWDWSQGESIPETGLSYKTTGKNNTYNLTYKPISHRRFSLSSNFKLSGNYQTAPSGTYEAVPTDTNIFTQNYTVTLLPIPNIPLNLGLLFENYKNNKNHPDAPSKIDTETNNTTYSAGLSLTPIPSLRLSSSYNEKRTNVVKDINPTIEGDELTKTTLANKVIFSGFKWGTLVYDRQDEQNGGEVQAGEVAEIDFLKITETLSLNISVPVDNPVLTSFLFTASLKRVNYKNLLNSSDDFVATLTTFEGTLNF
ncbi:MAG: hypothetical protein HQ596_00985 [Candidatus Saganbacteria bacterium]|nr:hypothetical protein [Candidatus Saganbacteria bacterium]